MSENVTIAVLKRGDITIEVKAGASSEAISTIVHTAFAGLVTKPKETRPVTSTPMKNKVSAETRSEQEWLDIIERCCAQKELTIPEWCHENDISVSAYRRAYTKLNKAGKILEGKTRVR